jgi:hypothetical protein
VEELARAGLRNAVRVSVSQAPTASSTAHQAKGGNKTPHQLKMEYQLVRAEELNVPQLVPHVFPICSPNVPRMFPDCPLNVP